MTPRDLGHHRPHRQCLLENPSFLVGRPPTTTPRPREHLDPTRDARLRLKLMVKHIHVPIQNQRSESPTSRVIEEGAVRTALTMNYASTKLNQSRSAKADGVSIVHQGPPIPAFSSTLGPTILPFSLNLWTAAFKFEPLNTPRVAGFAFERCSAHRLDASAHDEVDLNHHPDGARRSAAFSARYR